MSDTTTPASFLDEIACYLKRDGAEGPDLQAVLEKVLRHFGCAAGTLHRLDSGTGLLHLKAHHGIPTSLLDRLESIPVGKGMAGLAAERRQPVQVCNLQTDSSGVARPAARETHMAGSLAVPILAGGELRAVLGIAKPVAYKFSSGEVEQMQEIAGIIGRRFADDSTRTSR
jgi:GAF domain-containing protein